MPLPSYVCGASDLPLLGETIGVHLDRSVSRWPDREALVVRHQNIRWSYAELQKKVDDLAAGLLSLGLEPGDRIGIWSPNNAEWVLTQFASAKAGLILVTVNPAYRTSELQHALRKSGCKALVLADQFKGCDYLAMLRSVSLELNKSEPGCLRSEALRELKWVIHLGEAAEPGMLRFPDVQHRAGAAERTRLEGLQ